MRQNVTIKFVGDRKTRCYFLKLGPMEEMHPREREFRGGDEVAVILTQRPEKPDAVDITFADGDYALEVPTEFFIILPK
jgi:hypothetical protein